MYLRTRVTPFLFFESFDMLMNKKWAYKENNEDSYLSCGKGCGKRLPKIMERPIILKLVWYSPSETISLLKQTGPQNLKKK